MNKLYALCVRHMRVVIYTYIIIRIINTCPCNCNNDGIVSFFFSRLGENSKYGSVNEDLFMSTPPTMSGTFVRQPSNGSGKQLVYCIHGKPSGCCATLVSSDDNNSNREKPDLKDGKSSITICMYPLYTIYAKPFITSRCRLLRFEHFYLPSPGLLVGFDIFYSKKLKLSLFVIIAISLLEVFKYFDRRSIHVKSLTSQQVQNR